MRELIRETRRIHRLAIRAYVEQRMRLRVREIRRETDREIRETLRAHDLGSVAFD